jgi:hypothetical protein
MTFKNVAKRKGLIYNCVNIVYDIQRSFTEFTKRKDAKYLQKVIHDMTHYLINRLWFPKKGAVKFTKFGIKSPSFVKQKYQYFIVIKM